ncbi:SDR family NAD(P)-dependent oxidoreductase [Roseobacter denitrificans]|uniref:Oxidoreductase, putative n=1 Tax=Roseobacter denitrificans (strain ATCC 33942 / OCh 114) TaxID=375451 RepID=Q166N1_ROSDO|nr:SDR family oxidoreductase [Roseobacter denitrificans]ABG32062.1 oxidoreductase, putative [Roseobacter denitrificans OCh 114]AVL51585.1 SDR family NAD(P)-dependent oxidoreductase [Roseobacter denitrificans]SFF76830.1 NADP-dependent 3-hydroxy acid dehydrogenase YdfG [Roseobacter denitrificans OCh 114]
MTDTKTILITGASRGIGHLASLALAAHGHRVYAGMRDIAGSNKDAASAMQAQAQAERLNLVPLELDVTNAQACQTAIDKIEADGPLDVLVNNAGVMPVGLTEAFTMEQAKDVFDVNVYGIMRLTRAALPCMRARKSGLVINLSSSAGRFGMPYFGIYCASKWAVEAYSEALHHELETFGITCVLIEPSGHGTDLVTTAPAPQDTARLEAYGDLAAGRERLLDMFGHMFATDLIGTDANNVATAIAQLIEMPGARPMRVQVGHDMGVSAVNEAVAPLQAKLIETLKPVYRGARQA